MRRQSVILTASVIMVACLFSCNRNTLQNPIPNVFVNEFVYLSNPSSLNLAVQGGTVYNQGGYRGLVVYRKNFNQTSDDFVAFDRACPIHYKDSCGMLEVVDQIFLECPCDGQQFLLIDGLPLDGKSPQLRFYNTYFDGVDVIRINN